MITVRVVDSAEERYCQKRLGNRCFLPGGVDNLHSEIRQLQAVVTDADKPECAHGRYCCAERTGCDRHIEQLSKLIETAPTLIGLLDSGSSADRSVKGRWRKTDTRVRAPNARRRGFSSIRLGVRAVHRRCSSCRRLASAYSRAPSRVQQRVLRKCPRLFASPSRYGVVSASTRVGRVAQEAPIAAVARWDGKSGTLISKSRCSFLASARQALGAGTANDPCALVEAPRRRIR